MLNSVQELASRYSVLPLDEISAGGFIPIRLELPLRDAPQWLSHVETIYAIPPKTSKTPTPGISHARLICLVSSHLGHTNV